MIIRLESEAAVHSGHPALGGAVLEAQVNDGDGLTRYAVRIRRRYADLWSLINRQELQSLGQLSSNASDWRDLFERIRLSFPEPKAALRVLRQLVVSKLCAYDTGSQLGLSTVTAVMTGLAEFSLRLAQSEVTQELARRHGRPLSSQGRPLDLWVVGMGKLGGRELNVSSDIDLIYLYGEEGETSGNDAQNGSISNAEFFTKCARGMQAWIADMTEHGFVFRIDLALRPHGSSGPMVCALSALRGYLMSQGREWERLAWMKSRVITPDLTPGEANAIRELVTPFVYRRYLDYPVFDALRDLHRQIRVQASKRAMGRPNRIHDVKLGRGGIREIEFLVQSQQIVRGGQYPELRTRSTLKGLLKLATARLMDPPLAERLGQDYTFLRNLEHAIQYLDDAHTHELPSQDDDLSQIAQRLGFESMCTLLSRLDETRERVAAAFDEVLGPIAPASNSKCKGCNCEDPNVEEVEKTRLTSEAQRNSAAEAAPLATSWPSAIAAELQAFPELLDRVQRLAAHSRRLALKPSDDARLGQLLQRTVATLSSGQREANAVSRGIDWLEGLLKKEGYLALLVERPQVLSRALKLLSSSRWAVRYLQHHPSVVDQLAVDFWLSERFEPNAWLSELRSRRAALAQGMEDDEESLMNLLRRAHRAEVFKTLARDLERRLSVEQVADELSALADATLQISLEWIWQDWWRSGDRRAHQSQAELVILAYGKLGGKELGYGSDLDLVFIHGDDHERAQECYASLAKKLISWLTTKTALGDLYEIDTALRPNGSAGLLVTHIDAFERYQVGRGSNAAWTWEHQAITRARPVCGPAALVGRVESVRSAVLQSARAPDDLRREISSMRERMRAAHPETHQLFDLKHSPGGMIDVEFAVQTLVLLHARTQPALLQNIGNIGLLMLAEAKALLPKGVGVAAADGYRNLRSKQHALRLNEEPLRVPPQEWIECRASIQRLWGAIGLG